MGWRRSGNLTANLGRSQTSWTSKARHRAILDTAEPLDGRCHLATFQPLDSWTRLAWTRTFQMMRRLWMHSSATSVLHKLHLCNGQSVDLLKNLSTIVYARLADRTARTEILMPDMEGR